MTTGDKKEPKDPLDVDESVEVFPVTLEFERATPVGTFAFTNATLITMAGDEVIEGGDIIVTDNRITALGPTGSVEIPPGAEVVDASDRFIVPVRLSGRRGCGYSWRSRVSSSLRPATLRRHPEDSHWRDKKPPGPGCPACRSSTASRNCGRRFPAGMRY